MKKIVLVLAAMMFAGIVQQAEGAARRPHTATIRVGGPRWHIGIVNCRKRLDLLYPGRYTLEIREQADEYRVTLDLKLH